MLKMRGLSKKEIEIISNLEFNRKYFFTSKDIDQFARNKTHRYNIIKNLVKKKRIVKINKIKYYLIPIKAKSGSWIEHSFILADEICNGNDYFIGGWSAAHYYRLTDQIPMWIQIYTTKRQGKTKILNSKFIFHRTTKKRIERSIKKTIQKHIFKIQNKRDTKKWMKSRE